MTTADPFGHDDAAYVFGALSADERHAFEAHLQTCLECTGRVAQTRTVAAQLAGLDESAFAGVECAGADIDGAESAPPDTLLPALLRAARRERDRRRGVFAGLAAVAVACA
ncbi:MAG: zf-HC2 domain-containing protein, partial [Actinomycetota bacterium]|nr:zf-HC2 domain-containing protein [Actinomycetota bacterium]